nr:Cation channel sperm-associated protein 3 [Polyrhizophydium stewartii]
MCTNVVDLIILLVLFLFIFSVIGHFLFGIEGAPNASRDWGTLLESFNTLWVYVCADGWTPYQDNLTTDGFTNSPAFTKSKKDLDFQSMVKDMVGTLRHDEIIPTKHLSLNLTWLETFVVTLHYHENTMFRCQQCHFAMAHALAEYVDKRLASKQEL